MKYWWVSQNQTYKQEVPGGFMWSPKTKKNGAKNHFYDNMRQVRAGDIILSFCDTEIKAIGIATGSAQSRTKPDFGAAGDQWDNHGWFVPVRFEEVYKPVKPKDFIEELRLHFAAKYNPIKSDGRGNEIYLAEISENFLNVVLSKMGKNIGGVVGAFLGEAPNVATIVLQSLSSKRRDLSFSAIEERVEIILSDLMLLARIANSKCLVTYGDAIALRGHGNAKNGKWLDEVYEHGIAPLQLPDLTMLIVSQKTRKPSEGVFKDGIARLSGVRLEGIEEEQRQCFWFTKFEEIFGSLEPIPSKFHLVRNNAPQPSRKREIARAVDNAIGRVNRAGKNRVSSGREYLKSLSRAELLALTDELFQNQSGRCALTRTPFDLRTDAEGGVQADRVSLDRIDNAIGYADGNIQLTTQFANRARGELSVEEAKNRLVQHEENRN